MIYGGGLLGTSNSELYIASYRTYHRGLADLCNYDKQRFSGVAYLAAKGALSK